jgi:hypothetical protein
MSCGPKHIAFPGRVSFWKTVPIASNIGDQLRWGVLFPDEEHGIPDNINVESKGPIGHACESEKIPHGAAASEEVQTHW